MAEPVKKTELVSVQNLPEGIKWGSAVFKDDQGHTVGVQGWTPDDVQTAKQMKSDIEDLKQKVAAANSGQRELAYKDLTQPGAETTGLNAGTYYLVPFNASNQFLEFDPATGKPKNPQTVPETTDLIVKYFTIMYFNGTALANVGRQDVQANLSNVVYDNKNATLTAEYTFSNDITVNATQTTSLGDNKVATAKFVRDTVAAAGHMKGKYYATDPGVEALVTNELAFIPAVNLLS